MKKLIYLSIVAGLILMSCQNNNEYTIKGEVAHEAFEGSNVYMQQMTDDAMVVTDSVVVRNGEFTFSGVAENTVLRFITLDESINVEQEKRVPVLIEPGNIIVRFDTVITVSGSKVNDDYNNVRLQQRDLSNQIREVIGRYNAAQSDGSLTETLQAEVNEQYENIQKQFVDLNFDFVKNNMSNELGEHVFTTSSSMFEPDQQRELLADAGESFKANSNVKRIIDRLESLEKVEVGKKFSDFTLKDPEGKEVSLSDYAGQGKYVLIDFWAAWCGPCRREMPYVVDAYDKYKSKGFEVVGVSFDETHEEWTQGIKDLNITWPQMSDLKYWESPVVDQYAIVGIPHTILLDREEIESVYYKGYITDIDKEMREKIYKYLQ